MAYGADEVYQEMKRDEISSLKARIKELEDKLEDMLPSYCRDMSKAQGRIKELEGALSDAIEFINYEPKEVLRLNDILQGYKAGVL